MPLVNEDTDEAYSDEIFPDYVFFDACYEGNLKSVHLRLSQGCCVNAVTAEGLTALMLAAWKGQKKGTTKVQSTQMFMTMVRHPLS